MAVSDYSTTPASNTTISGINIAEQCPPANINNALRQMMADVRVFYNSFTALSSGMPITGGAFTGDITRDGRGAYMHWNSSSQASARIFIQATGGAAPTMANGDWLLEY